MVSLYLNSYSVSLFEKPLDVIKRDSLKFYTLFLQEVELWEMLHPQSGEKNKQYSKSILDIFRNDISTMNIFFRRIQGKKGTKVVNEVLALRELRKIKQDDEITNQLLFDEISKVCPIGGISTFNSAFDLGSSKNKVKRKMQIDEAKKAY